MAKLKNRKIARIHVEVDPDLWKEARAYCVVEKEITYREFLEAAIREKLAREKKRGS